MAQKVKKVKEKMTADMKIFIVVCIIIAVVLISAVIYLAMPKNVATVQNNKVSKAEFQYYLNNSMQTLYLQLGIYTGQDYYTFMNSAYGEGTQTWYDVAKSQALSQAVQIEYLLQEAKKEGFKVDPKEISDEWSKFESDIKAYAANNNLSVQDYYKQVYGINQNQLKEIIKNMYIAQKYMEAKIDAIVVDEAELASYYEENKTTFDYNSVRHILITCEEDAEESVVNEKSKAAQDILDRVNKGEDFSELARQYSEDEGSKDSGGVIEVQQNGMMVPEFEEWAFSHKVGETGIVKTQYGFHVMILDSINNNLEQVRDRVVDAYKSDRFQTSVNEILNSDSYNIKLEEGYYEF